MLPLMLLLTLLLLLVRLLLVRLRLRLRLLSSPSRFHTPIGSHSIPLALAILFEPHL